MEHQGARGWDGGQPHAGGACERRRAALLLLVAAFTLVACTGGNEVRDEQGDIVAAGTWSVFDLRDGDCLDPDPELSGEISDVAVVPCDQPHAQEVFATVEHPAGTYPGAGAVSVWADGACLGELESTLGLTLDDGVYVSYLLPTFDGWNQDDDRRVVCVLVFPDREAAVGSFVSGTAGITPAEPAPPQLPTEATDAASATDNPTTASAAGEVG